MCRTYNLLPRPPILTSVPTATMGACTPATPSFPWLWFPASAMFGLGWVKFPVYLLPVAEFLHQLWGRQPKVHKVAKTTTVTFPIFILPAASFPKVRDGGQLSIKRPSYGQSLE